MMEQQGAKQHQPAKDVALRHVPREECIKGITKVFNIKIMKNEMLNYNCTMQKNGKNRK